MDVNKLQGVIPDKVLDALTTDFLQKSGINGPFRLSHFLGQTEEESGKFTKEIENLNYSATALEQLFSRHFPNGDYADYARQPERIADRIYASRMGNGDEASGDGWKYRGRGDLQITGKEAYQAFQDWINEGKSEPVDLISNPDLLCTAPYDLLSAAWFFTVKGIWAICDQGIDGGTITEVTRKVNGGTINLDQRISYTRAIHAALTN